MAYFSAEKADSESIRQLILRGTYLQASLLWFMIKIFRGEGVVDGEEVAVKDACVQDPHSGSEIDAKIQQQLVFKFYISELQNYLQFRYLYTRAFVIQN